MLAADEKTLDWIIDFCEENFEFDGGDRVKYKAFLQRQVDKHSYDLNKGHFASKTKISTGYFFRDILRDKLLLFSYMIGETAVYFNDGSSRKIGKDENDSLKDVEERIKDFKLLSDGKGGRDHNKDDKQLHNLTKRLGTKSPYGTFVNELCLDIGVMDYYDGHVLCYKDANPNTKIRGDQMPGV